jgi:starvation-inducible DNA-binding protein
MPGKKAAQAARASTIKSDIDVDLVGTDLQETLVELIDLYLRAKQAHWNVAGRQFRSLHRQLDLLADEVRATADLVAERAATIGYAPDGRPGTVAKSTPMLEFPAGQVLDADVVELVTEALAEVCQHVRGRIGHTADLVSQNLLVDTLATLEKHYWMFAVQRVSASRA